MVAIVVLVLFGCVTPQKKVPLAPEGPKSFQQGYTDGCKTGYVYSGDMAYKSTRNNKRFSSDAEYQSGWEKGFFECLGELKITETTKRAVELAKLNDKIAETKLIAHFSMPPHTAYAMNPMSNKNTRRTWKYPTRASAVSSALKKCRPPCVLFAVDGEIVWEKSLAEWEDKFIESAEDINTKVDKNGNTILHLAAWYGNARYAKRAVEKGANVNARNARNKSENTPLTLAAVRGHVSIVDLLIEKKADISAADEKHGSSSLHWASGYGHYDVVKLLIEKGAAVNARNKHKATALLIASDKGYAGIVKLLIENGADIEMGNTHKASPLLFAAWRGHTDVAKLLIENGADVNTKSKAGKTALALAKAEGHDDVVKLLVENGAQ